MFVVYIANNLYKKIYFSHLIVKMVECTDDKIMNPTTKRCVLKTGKIGIEILKTQKSQKSQF